MGDLLPLTVSTGNATSTSPVRSGAYSFRIGGGNSANYKDLPSAYSELYIRFGWYKANNDTNQQICAWAYGGTYLGCLKINGGYLCLYTSTGTLVASSSFYPLSNTWYLLELRVKIADSGGVLNLKVDGTSILTYTGDTKPGTDTTINRFYFGVSNNYWYHDDIAINDTSGAADNSWCGDGKIIALTPNGNGDVSQLTGSDGDSTDNYLHVDEAVSDGDTTYTQSESADNYDLYNLTNCGLSHVTINRVWVEARARDTVADGGNCQLGLKTTSEYWSSNISLLTTYTKQVLGTFYTTNPYTGSAWTTTQLDGLQAGFKVK